MNRQKIREDICKVMAGHTNYVISLCFWNQLLCEHSISCTSKVYHDYAYIFAFTQSTCIVKCAGTL